MDVEGSSSINLNGVYIPLIIPSIHLTPLYRCLNVPPSDMAWENKPPLSTLNFCIRCCGLCAWSVTARQRSHAPELCSASLACEWSRLASHWGGCM